MSSKTFAAIDVGSFELTMKIFEFNGKGGRKEIDCIREDRPGNGHLFPREDH